MKLNNLELKYLATLSKFAPLAVFDLETTGINIVNDRICEICVYRFENGTYKKFTTMIDPLMIIPEEASNVHGITLDVIKKHGAKPLHFYAHILEEFFEGAVLVTFNGDSFDVPLLIQEFSRIKRTFDFSKLETLDVRNIYVKNNGRTLSDAYRHYLGEDMVDAHQASADVEATICILEAQLITHGLTDMTLRELIDYSKFTNKKDTKKIGETYPDYQKKFAIKNGITYFNFGKHKGLPVLSERGYLKWMLTAKDKDSGAALYMDDTLNHVSKLLNGEVK